MSTDASRLIDAYLAESLAARGLPTPRLRDVPAARRLYEMDAPVRTALAIECAHRIAWELDHPHYITSLMMAGPWKRLKVWLRQKLFPKRYGFERVVMQHGKRYEQLYSLLLFRLPPLDASAAETLLDALPRDLSLFPYRATFRAIAKAERSPKVEALVRRHSESLTYQTPDTVDDCIAAVLAYGLGATEFDDYRAELDPEQVPEHLRHLTSYAQTWGIGDDGARHEFVTKTTTAAQHRMWRAVKPHEDEIDAWLDETDAMDFSEEQGAFLYLLSALHEVDEP